jgi:hypothetical protein
MTRLLLTLQELAASPVAVNETRRSIYRRRRNEMLRIAPTRGSDAQAPPPKVLALLVAAGEHDDASSPAKAWPAMSRSSSERWRFMRSLFLHALVALRPLLLKNRDGEVAMTITDRGQAWAQAQLDQGNPIMFPDEWTEGERTLGGDFVAKAVLGWPAKAALQPFTLGNAIVDGPLDLQGAGVEAELIFEHCRFRHAVLAREATFSRRVRFSQHCVFDDAVIFDSCTARHLWFTRELELAGEPIKEPGATFRAQVSFVASRILGSLCFDGARFLGPETFSLNGASVSASVFMQSAEFYGPVVFTALQIDLGLFGARAKFNDWGALADFSSMKIKLHALLEDAVFLGPATFELSEIDGNFSLARSRFFDSDSATIFANMRIGKLADMRGATFWGAVNFYQADIGGSLRCDDMTFLETGQTLYGSALKVKGETSLINATIHGPAEFGGMAADGRLYCDGATFLSYVSFTGARFASHISAANAQFKALADFSHLEVGGDLLFPSTSFGAALQLYSSDIKGSAQLDRSVCRGRALFTNMVIHGELQCRGMVFHDEANFVSVACEGAAYFDFTKFKGDAKFNFFSSVAGHFRRTKFHRQADFSGIKLKGTGHYTGAKFGGPVDFRNAAIDEDLRFESAAREKPPKPARVVFMAAVNGDGIEVGRELALSECVFRHQGELTLRFARIGLLDCRGNGFRSVTCFSARIRDGLLFERNVITEDAVLAVIKVGGRSRFGGTIFKKECDFSEADLQGVADFGAKACDDGSDARPCTFESAAKFDRTRFGGKTYFDGTVFHATASFKAAEFLDEVTIQRLAGGAGDKTPALPMKFDFGHAAFSGPLTITDVTFGATVSFSKCRFLSRVGFVNVAFNGPAASDEYDDSVVFAEARFESQLVLSETTVRRRLAFFGAVHENRLFVGTNCRFDDRLDLRNARLTILDIDHTGRPAPTDLSFLGKLLLDGCTYQRLVHDGIEPEILWRQFHKSLGSVDTATFQRQPYLEFERVCRGAGKDKLADQVYFDLRAADGRLEHRWIFRLWNWTERLVFGYGVRPLRLIATFLIAWIGGALVFGLLHGSVDMEHGKLDVAESLRNLVPGLDKLIKIERPSSGVLETGVSILQYVLGWALLALLAHRFFKGLKR